MTKKQKNWNIVRRIFSWFFFLLIYQGTFYIANTQTGVTEVRALQKLSQNSCSIACGRLFHDFSEKGRKKIPLFPEHERTSLIQIAALLIRLKHQNSSRIEELHSPTFCSCDMVITWQVLGGCLWDSSLQNYSALFILGWKLIPVPPSSVAPTVSCNYVLTVTLD